MSDVNRSCDRCIRLWQDYADATNKLILLTNKLEVAALCHDNDVIAEVTPEIEDAARVRERVRDAIYEHEAATGHSTEDAAAE